jgi:N-ethylmaleimide reductase
MAPMTRSRAVERNVPNPVAATYYAQRASAGLIVTEATQVSPQGVGYIRTPGIHSAEQVAGWTRITEAVHRADGKIFLQLWHVGRISHPQFHGGELPVAPSAIAAHGQVFTAKGPQQMVTPRALALDELPGVVQQFRRGAENAKAAAFDGVELHGANGYLLDQFLCDGSNKRSDAYGGTVENRAHLPLEVTKAVIDVWGADRVGYRISPNGAFNSMSDSNPILTFSYLAEQLIQLGIVYLHVIDLVGDGGTRRCCAGNSIAATSLMAASISTAPMRRSATAKPISSLSACRFSPIRICRSGTGSRRRSTRPIRQPSMPGKARASPTIRLWRERMQRYRKRMKG